MLIKFLKPRELLPLAPAAVWLRCWLLITKVGKVQRHKVRLGRHFRWMSSNSGWCCFSNSCYSIALRDHLPRFSSATIVIHLLFAVLGGCLILTLPLMFHILALNSGESLKIGSIQEIIQQAALLHLDPWVGFLENICSETSITHLYWSELSKLKVISWIFLSFR